MTRHELYAIHPCESRVAGEHQPRPLRCSIPGKAVNTWGCALIVPLRLGHNRPAKHGATLPGLRSSARELHRNPKSP